MKRHYVALKQIKNNKRKRPVSCRNHRFEMKLKSKKRKNPTQLQRERQLQKDNHKILRAIEDVESKWGELNKYKLSENEYKKDKTMGFKRKSNKEMIKESMAYLDKLKKVKPYYQKTRFRRDQNFYLRMKKNLDINRANLRKFETKSFKSNTKKLLTLKGDGDESKSTRRTYGSFKGTPRDPNKKNYGSFVRNRDVDILSVKKMRPNSARHANSISNIKFNNKSTFGKKKPGKLLFFGSIDLVE